ncbi:hypothetical protein [Cytobacillus massiliigabonensis]|uniref:hypothetical protein n=1 Tax=Cytobacillus massiliigabonensis TaxID=1871011 RepID=UPI001F2AF924|nr:hypothetical protein [Cytobacillus massiliigabonensis]
MDISLVLNYSDKESFLFFILLIINERYETFHRKNRQYIESHVQGTIIKIIKRGEVMGFWYFLILFLGIFFVIKGFFMKKSSLLIKKMGFVIVGLVCISFSIFMFSPGSAEIISNLFNMD